MLIANKNLPNYLTIFRLLIVIPYIILFSLIAYRINYPGSLIIDLKSIWSVNFIIFIIAMITDFFDGYLARKYKNVSTFGKLFDPIADKIMINTTLIFLAITNLTFAWVVVLFILRDIVVDGARNLMASKGVEVAASIWGKLKTVFQTLAIIVLFAIAIPFYGNDLLIDPNITIMAFVALINIPTFVALTMSYISGYLYLKPLFKHLKISRKSN
ncbi:CDP-diacylglycerol--glycerol-3-phosphate 3-phosphatidyltransferase [Mycoplasmopsis agassizii]|uniref:CDP-diacylglycerol--glycerol-3-phosphate 3-phosphatidyltransferase n=1 Tax=Mycoplasmopsis agassizii TaxID=33922 RepID=UPI00352871BF